jgi:hypothetical protein
MGEDGMGVQLLRSMLCCAHEELPPLNNNVDSRGMECESNASPRKGAQGHRGGGGEHADMLQDEQLAEAGEPEDTEAVNASVNCSRC